MWKWLLFVASVANIVLIAHTTEIDSTGCKGDVNAVKGCGNCPITCQNYNNTEPPVCIQICYEDACDCKPGYVLDVDTNKCILPSQCVSCGGDPNAEPGCSFNCGRHCSNYNQTVICPRIQCPPNGCQCKNNYVYDDNIGKCVRPSECTPTCGTDEYFSSCANGGCFTARTCEDLDNFNGNTVCARPIKCIGGCLCNDGLVRNDNGICIPESECPNSKCKGANETYIASSYGRCVPETCKDVGQPLPCESTPNQPGDPRCVCVNGYVRDNSGKCIPTDQCSTCGGDPNAKPGCGVNCGRLCSNYNKEPVACILICNLNGCDCNEGYVYDSNIQRCVLPQQCSPVCGKNEKYTSCVEGGCYGARNCSEISNGENVPVRCVKPLKCTEGCICDDGFLRNDNGVCVRAEECKPNDNCNGVNEYWDTCPPNCVLENCSDKGHVLDCPPQTEVCKPRCRYAQGYLRDNNGVCVQEEKCDEMCFGINEVWDPCPSCGPNTCESIGQPAPSCPAMLPNNCKGACRCEPGYYRNKIGQCISKENCLKCTGPHEYYSCGGACDNVCATLSTQNQTSCPIINIKCNEMCYCEDGYARDDQNNCVPFASCPPTPTCGPDEYLDSCANGGCYSARTCKDLDTLNGSIICVDPIQCTPGCLCKEGLVRNDKGVCVPENKCPNSKCKGDDETYSSSGGRCVPETCDQLGYPLPCENPNNTIAAEPGCVCRDGYVRGCTGKCIPKDQCPSCGGDPNAKPGCGVNCGRLCSNYNKGPVVCPRICKLNGCDCKEKYVFDSTLNKCVLPKRCYQCGKNEVYDTCVTTCPPRKCGIDDAAVLCAPIDPADCKPGCRCADGYVRNDQGECVNPKQCSCT